MKNVRTNRRAFKRTKMLRIVVNGNEVKKAILSFKYGSESGMDDMSPPFHQRHHFTFNIRIRQSSANFNYTFMLFHAKQINK